MKLAELQDLKRAIRIYLITAFIAIPLFYMMFILMFVFLSPLFDPARDTSEVVITSVALILFIAFGAIAMLGLAIVNLVFHIKMLIGASKIDDILTIVLMAVGFLYGIVGIVGAFVLNSKVNKLIEELEGGPPRGKTIIIDE